MASGDVSFDFVSQAGHALLGVVVMWFAIYVVHPWSLVVFLPGYILYGVIKEFWYDEKYESPEVRGSGKRDFFFLMLGAAAGLTAWGVSFLTKYLIHLMHHA